MSENEIIKGCLRNNRESQKALYELFYGKMKGVCLRYSNSNLDAEEVLQEGFLKVFENFKNNKKYNQVEDWMRKIMISASIDHIRKNKQKLLIVSTVHENKKNVVSTNQINDDTLFFNIGKEDILKAVQELSPGYRSAYNLFVIDGFSFKEIVEMLDLSEETLKLNLSKAKFALRKNLVQFLNTGNE